MKRTTGLLAVDLAAGSPKDEYKVEYTDRIKGREIYDHQGLLDDYLRPEAQSSEPKSRIDLARA